MALQVHWHLCVLHFTSMNSALQSRKFQLIVSTVRCQCPYLHLDGFPGGITRLGLFKKIMTSLGCDCSKLCPIVGKAKGHDHEEALHTQCQENDIQCWSASFLYLYHPGSQLGNRATHSGLAFPPTQHNQDNPYRYIGPGVHQLGNSRLF